MHKKLLPLCLVLLLPILPSFVHSQILINEFVADNTSYDDNNGNSSDWIELYNAGDEAIDLLNYTLSDDLEEPGKWVFPSISIDAKGYLVVFASGSDVKAGPSLHTNFQIRSAGEPLILSDASGTVLSEISPVMLPEDQAYACITDGVTNHVITTPTPNSSNANANGIYCSHKSGAYTDSIQVSLTPSNNDIKIYYTLNGSVPTVNSNEYTEEITFRDVSQTTPTLSLIPTTPTKGEPQLYDYIWKEPTSVYKSNTFRYAAFKNDTMVGRIQTYTYFVDKDITYRYEFPIISLVTDKGNLFDHDTGIYVPGARFEKNGFNWFPEGNYNNRGREWERDVHISYFDVNNKLLFQTDAGMRMRGYGSVCYPQKSLNIYFKNRYGLGTIDYPLFQAKNTEKNKRIILRTSGNDWLQTHFRDAMLHMLMASMDLEVQNYKCSVVFINGEYWGIHNIREKYDEYYFKYKYDIDEDELNLLYLDGTVETGDSTDYMDLLDFFETADLSKTSNYNYAREKMDMANFIDYQIVEIYSANYDWPCNNYKVWKTNEADSKWRFLIYDLDYSFGHNHFTTYEAQSMEHATKVGNSWPHCPRSNLIFRKLLENEQFKDQFLDRFAFCLENYFSVGRVTNFISEFSDYFSNEMPEHIDRWNYPVDMGAWHAEVETLHEFAKNRPCSISKNIKSYFNLSDDQFECALGVDIASDNKLNIFPNPSRGDFSVTNNSSQLITNACVSLYNYSGQLVYSKSNFTIEPFKSIAINTQDLPDGIYIMQFSSVQRNQSKKLIISSGN